MFLTFLVMTISLFNQRITVMYLNLNFTIFSDYEKVI